jgi:hypothetical protein
MVAVQLGPHCASRTVGSHHQRRLRIGPVCAAASLPGDRRRLASWRARPDGNYLGTRHEFDNTGRLGRVHQDAVQAPAVQTPERRERTELRRSWITNAAPPRRTYYVL